MKKPFLITTACAALSLLVVVPLSAGTDTPFDGKTLEGWTTKNPKERSKWAVGVPKLAGKGDKALEAHPGTGAMVNETSGHGQSVDIYSTVKWGDCRIELDVMVAKGANSGIYVHGEYEVQVLDSYGREKLGSGDMGAVYGAAPPPVNACRKPGEWQHYVIEFRAPRFNDKGEKTENAKLIKVELNGKVLHENLVLKGPTPSGVTGKEHAEGPIMFQGDHGAVAYRNIRISAL